MRLLLFFFVVLIIFCPIAIFNNAQVKFNYKDVCILFCIFKSYIVDIGFNYLYCCCFNVSKSFQ